MNKRIVGGITAAVAAVLVLGATQAAARTPASLHEPRTLEEAQQAVPGASVLHGNVITHDGVYIGQHTDGLGRTHFAKVTVRSGTRPGTGAPSGIRLASADVSLVSCQNWYRWISISTGWLGGVGANVNLDSEYHVYNCSGVWGDWASPSCYGFLSSCGGAGLGWAPRWGWTSNAWYDQQVVHGIFGINYSDTYHLRTYARGDGAWWSWWS